MNFRVKHLLINEDGSLAKRSSGARANGQMPVFHPAVMHLYDTWWGRLGVAASHTRCVGSSPRSSSSSGACRGSCVRWRSTTWLRAARTPMAARSR